MDFEGIYTPVITPFNDDFSIDRQGFAAVIEHLIEAGVHGIVTSGTTGEYYAPVSYTHLTLPTKA